MQEVFKSNSIKLSILILLLAALAFELKINIPVDPQTSITRIQDKLAELRNNIAQYTYEKENLEILTRKTAGIDFLKFNYFKNGSLECWKELPYEYYQNDPILLEISSRTESKENDLEAFIALTTSARSLISEQILSFASSDHYFKILNVPTDYVLKDSSGQSIYYLLPLGRKFSPYILMWRKLLYLAAFCLFICYIYLIRKDRISDSGLFLTISILVSLRFGILSLDLFSWYSFNPFKTEDFHLSFWFPSVPDLALHSLTIFLITCSISRLDIHPVKSVSKYLAPLLLNIGHYWMIGLLWLSILFFTGYYIQNAPSFLNIEQLFSTSLFGLVVLIGFLLYIVSIFIFHFYLYKRIFSLEPNFYKRLISFGISLILLLPLFQFFKIDFEFGYAYAAFFVYIFLFDLFIDTRRLNITWLIWWMIILGSFTTFIFFHNINKKQDSVIRDYLQSSFHPIDPVMTDQLIQISKILDESEVQNLASITYPFKIDQNDLYGYFQDDISEIIEKTSFNNVDLHCIDRFGNSIIDDQLWRFNELRKKLSTALKIDSTNLYDPFTKSYFISYSLENRNHPASPFLFLLELYSPEKNTWTIENVNNAVFGDPVNAIYKSNELINFSGPGFTDNLPNYQETFTEEIKGGLKWIIYKPNSTYSIVSKYQIVDLIKPVSLFSYLFSLMGLLLVGLSFLHLYFDFFPFEFNLTFERASLRNKIQISVVALIILAFVIIGFVTVYYFLQVSNNFTKQRLAEKTTAIIKDIQYNYLGANDAFNEKELLENRFSELSFTHQSELFLFNEFARLDKSTLRANSAKYDVKLPYQAFVSLQDDFNAIYFDEQDMSQYDGLVSSAYTNLTNNLGKRIGFLQVLTPQSKSSTFNVGDFIGTMLNVYVFLFLIAGAIAIAVANSITYPIAVLGDKLRRFKLGKQNEPLVWKNKDELGALIEEYNQMIVKLEESAEFIAKTERDSAWREMAKQVAHEIKNPLTPMKLSIQYLEKAIHRNPDNAHQYVERVSSTLIEQIDNLSQIANEFSNFAKLPQARNEKVILNEIVEVIHDLFRKREDMDIILQEPIDDIVVFADKNHLIRILNNIIKNAIQAIPNDKRGKIVLHLYKESDKAIIKISDNGKGIPLEMQDKVFSPNFTTKSSGTGLGLAISANMIDSFNGRIYFTTEENIGTDFYVEIPLMKLEDNYKDKNRVTLD